MSPDRTAADIQRLGFRRWYERQLIESHAYLVTAFLALVLLLAGFEALDAVRGHPTYWLLLILVSAGAGLVTYVGWRRFTALLARAEAFAGGAECPNCKAWSPPPPTIRPSPGGRIGCACAAASARRTGGWGDPHC